MKGRLAGIAVLALVAAGCGGGGGGGGSSSSSAEGIVPADAVAFLSVDTDFSSKEMTSAQAILDKFPIKQTLLAEIRKSLSSQGIDANALASSVGPELDVAILSVNGKVGAVGFAKPTDEKAFDAVLAKSSNSGNEPHQKIDGWTVFSDTQPYLDAVTNRKANLGDDATFQAAMKTLPSTGDAIATAYASTAGIQSAVAGAGVGSSAAASSALQALNSAKWFAGALTSSNGAFSFELHTKASAAGSTASGSGLADEIPSGSLVALSLVGGSSIIPANLQSQVNGLSTTLGINVTGLLGVLNGPVIAYVRAGLPLPEVTIAAKPSNPAQATAAIGQLIARLGQKAKPVPTQVDGGTLEKLDLGAVSILYGNVNGQVVVTDSANALTELKGSAGKLTDDSLFKDAKSASGMPDSTQGFLFVDLKDALPAVTGFAQLASQQLPPTVQKNLAPLRSLLVYGSQDSGIESGVFYLSTN